MQVSSASPWPSRAAYMAAAVFLCASGAVNLTYGWNKGSDIASSLTWAAVSVAVATTFALAWPVLIRSLDARRWSAALVATSALLLAGSYSITAVLRGVVTTQRARRKLRLKLESVRKPPTTTPRPLSLTWGPQDLLAKSRRPWRSPGRPAATLR
jgi:hypothetical protein